ncbi:PREDICTED: nucleobase-ascorbate transporter 7-like isoform X2 [Nelumbo nucifera]|uniref:Nucleobase-ascorbate transporter 7-like isoform X2 n=1 Tax=Nelumbo nucifera TaxID=4432 RepID=A0A1U8B9I9_NELNU|nr:PREDICTED: nucleobase-ascorbate transporter 7-like isoform X2 [Nelumbo nucifera]
MAGGVGGPASKNDDFQPHPVKEQLPGIDYCITSPPHWPEAIVLGFQHYLVVLGTTVLIPSIIVPQMGGGNEEKAKVIQSLLFVAGLNTLLQSLFGTRLPTVIGGSCTFVVPTISIALANRYHTIDNPQERFIRTMRGIQGALICASIFQIVVGFLGFWRNVVRFLSPLSAVPLVTLTGLGLYQLGFPLYLPNMVTAKRVVFDRFVVPFSVAVVWVYAHILTVAGAYKDRPLQTQISCRTDHSGLLRTAPWIRVPYPFQWGAPTFEVGEALAMMAASFAALIESTGTFIAVSRYGSATPVPPSVLSRGVGWQGIGILLDGMFGTGNGSTASVGNAGLLALTRVGSRRVVQISAGFMLFFSVLGKFGALFASIPMSIVAALNCILFSYVASAGLGFLQFCNLNSFRTKFILGFSFFMGFSVQQYFNEYVVVSGHGPVNTHSISFNNIMNVIFSSNVTVAAVVAFFLDCTLGRGDSTVVRDSGSHWWEKFRNFKTDSRSEEFYSLPCNLNKLFPSV